MTAEDGSRTAGTRVVASRVYTDERIQGILGRRFLRVCRGLRLTLIR